MWIDIPSDPKYFEIKNGTSFYNPTEIQVIEKILEDINDPELFILPETLT